MIYYLDFHPKALKEWGRLDIVIKSQLQKKLKERLQSPIVPKDRLRGRDNFYKIKLKKSGYRLVYKVKEQEVVVYVIKIGKRENNTVCDDLENRL